MEWLRTDLWMSERMKKTLLLLARLAVDRRTSVGEDEKLLLSAWRAGV